MKKMVIGLAIGMLIGSSSVALAASSSTVQATLVKYRIIIGGQPKQVKADQLSYKGNTYIKLREAGTLFGYNATFDASSRTIIFNSINSTEKWIPLSDLTREANITMEMDTYKKDMYNLIRGKEVIASFNTADLQENEERGSSVTTNGAIIYFSKINGEIVFNRESLKKAGFI